METITLLLQYEHNKKLLIVKNNTELVTKESYKKFTKSLNKYTLNYIEARILQLKT